MKTKHAALVLGILLALGIMMHAVEAASFGDKVLDFINFPAKYEKNPKLWDGVIFYLIFTFVSWYGLAKGFPNNKFVNYVLSGVIGAALGTAAVMSGASVAFFVPFAKNILFFMIFGAIWWFLAKWPMKNHKIMAFILAIVVSAASFFVYVNWGNVKVPSFGDGSKTYIVPGTVHETFEELGEKYDVDLGEAVNTKEGIGARYDALKVVLEKQLEAKRAEIAKVKEKGGDVNELEEERIAISKELQELERAKDAGLKMIDRNAKLKGTVKGSVEGIKGLVTGAKEFVEKTVADAKEKKEILDKASDALKKLEDAKKRVQEEKNAKEF